MRFTSAASAALCHRAGV